MLGQTLILATDHQRRLAHQLVDRAPPGAVLNLREATRSPDQNAMMWALLSDISRAKPGGRVLTPDVWKSLFFDALGHSVRFEPGLEGLGMVPIGYRSSRLSKSQMTALIELILEYGARHGVAWSGQAVAA